VRLRAGEEFRDIEHEPSAGVFRVGGARKDEGGGADFWGLANEMRHIQREAGAFGFDIGSIQFGQRGAGFSGEFAGHSDDDGAVGNGIGHFADHGDDFGAPAAIFFQAGVVMRSPARTGGMIVRWLNCWIAAFASSEFEAGLIQIPEPFFFRLSTDPKSKIAPPPTMLNVAGSGTG
jgi:hypothetical protein